MDDLTDLLREVNKSDAVVVPYTSHGRLKSWTRERFRIKNRRYFWITVVAVSTCVVFSSGNIVSTISSLFMLFFRATPLYQSGSFDFDGAMEWIRSFSAFLSSVSPVDNFFRVVFDLVDVAGRQPGSEQTFGVLGVVAIGIWLVVLARFSLSTKSDFSMTAEGLSLIFQLTFAPMKGPVVPWSEITGISFRRTGDDASPDGFIDFTYIKTRWQYKLGQSAGEAGVNKFSLDLRNLNTLEQRHAVGRAIERWAPPNTVQPEVVENLSSTQSQAYTELWLQALTAPSKRQSLEPLTSGKKLQGGKYEIHSQLAVGGQGTAYLAQSAEPIAGLPAPALVDHSQHGKTSISDGSNKAGSNSVPQASGNGSDLAIEEPDVLERSEDDGDHIIKLDSANIVVKEFVLPLFVDSNSRKEALRKFLDEADLLKRLDHDRVVKLSDCFVEDHRGYLVLERIYGNSLYQIVLKNGAFTEGRVLELLDQMLDVLSYLHSQVPPVVHRDFAPDNLILGNDGILKLVDFNVAQQTENSVVGTIVGKQSYVPPEQLRGMATPASDIYALGATLYFLLTAQNPEPLSVSHPIDIVPHISKEFDQLVASCTRLDEADRFKNVEEIRTAVNKTLKWHDQKLT